MLHIRSLALRCVALASAAISVAPAGATAPPTPQTSGLFFRSDVADGLFAAPVVSSDVVVDVTGDIARVTVTQRFRNPSKVWLEGIYVYPLPERSAVDRLTMRVGDRAIEGVILEKQAAAQAYKAAVDAGKRAALLSSARPNVFSTRIANIGPGEEILVEIGYQDQVPFRDGEWSYRFPMVVAPRYTPAAGLPLVAVPPQPTETPQPPIREIAHRAEGPSWRPTGRDVFGPVRDPRDGAINPLSMVVRLSAGVPVDTITAANHKIVVERDGADVARVALAAGPVPADRDFVLAWRPVSAADPRVGLFTERRGDDAHLLVTLMPPDSDRWPRATVPRDLVLVIDKSGSMHGPSIDGARKAAQLALDGLGLHDRFNVIVFDNEPGQLFREVRQATPANLGIAAAALAALKADGGTEMADALDIALAHQAPEGRLRQVVFLTDGSVSNERALTRLIETKLGATRLFTVGLGAAPNAFFMRAAAEAGRGTYVYIDQPEELLTKMSALHEKLARPALTDIRIDWALGDKPAPEVFPNTIRDLYIGDPVSFVARFDGVRDGPLPGTLTVFGQLAGRDWSAELPLDAIRKTPGVASLWGRAKVASLRNAWPSHQPDREAMRRAVLETALDFQLVTEFTSLVAIDHSIIARPRDQDVEAVEIDRNLPDGMDFGKIFGANAFGPAGMVPVPAPLLKDAVFRQAVGLPATATPAPVLLAGGGALLLAGLLLIAGMRRTADGSR